MEENLLKQYADSNDLSVTRTSKGVYYQIHKKGKGATGKYGTALCAHYTGKLLNGKVFDSSYERGAPLKFRIGEMIPGWNEVLQQVPNGSKLTLLIPSHLAYGEYGFPPLIPPNSPLIFEVELIM